MVLGEQNTHLRSMNSVSGGAMAQWMSAGLAVAQKVAGLSLTWADSWKIPPVHPAISGYLTLVREG